MVSKKNYSTKVYTLIQTPKNLCIKSG